MPGDIDDIIGAGHHKDVAILINKACIAGFVIAGIAGKVAFDVTLRRVPHRGKNRRRQGQFGANGADGASRYFPTFFIKHHHVPTGHGPGGGTSLDGQ